jgi:hypothetical protein
MAAAAMLQKGFAQQQLRNSWSAQHRTAFHHQRVQLRQGSALQQGERRWAAALASHGQYNKHKDTHIQKHMLKTKERLSPTGILRKSCSSVVGRR